VSEVLITFFKTQILNELKNHQKAPTEKGLPSHNHTIDSIQPVPELIVLNFFRQHKK
jgi:hypothetical protein